MNAGLSDIMLTNSTEVYTDGRAATSGGDYVFGYKQRIAVSVMYSLISITGIIGNAFVILAVLLSKKLHTLTNILVVNLSVTDFLTCWIILIQVVVLLTSDQALRVVPNQLCILAGGALFVGICSSMMTLALIAFMRWYVITRSIRGHSGLHTPGKIAALVAVAWTTSLVSMLLPPGLGLGTLGYSVIYKQCCTIDDNLLVIYYSMIQGCGTLIFVAIAVYFYCAIFLFVRKNNQKFLQNLSHQDNISNVNESQANLKKECRCTTQGDDMNIPPIRSLSYLVENGHHHHDHSIGELQMAMRFRKREMRVTRNLFMVFCLFLVCVFPCAVSLAIPGGSIFNIYTAVLMYCNSCINPVIYCLKHDQFKEVLRPILRCRWSKIPQPTNFLRRCFPRSDHDSQMSSITSSTK